MKRKLLALLITFIVMISAHGAVILVVSHMNNGTPMAKHGQLDLTHWDFSRSGTIQLNGEWDFYPNQLILPTDLSANQTAEATNTIPVPGPWFRRMRHPLGIGTYQLQVKVGDTQSIYGIQVQSAQMASRVFINGQSVGGSGSPAQRNSYIGKMRPLSVYSSCIPG